MTAFGQLFTSAPYLAALEDSAAVCPQTGWTRIADITAPCYLKTHSWGEFVFDFEFARAYEEAGLAYYPKLVCAVPYTPVMGPRLGAELDAEKLQQLCVTHKASSAHVLFMPEREADGFGEQGWLLRHDVRLIWRQRDYADFEDFLAALASKKRKNIRAERKKVAELGLDIRWHHAAEFTASQWAQIYALYASTYHMRGQTPYLNQDCLMRWAQAMPQHYVFCVAWRDETMLAMAFFFRDAQCLYGRHWGALVDADGLHFELCYYRAIEYCLEQGLHTFDAGVQGEHRLLRGFEPQRTQSMHWFADSRFHTAIGDFLSRERAMQARRYELMQSKTAFRAALT